MHILDNKFEVQTEIAVIGILECLNYNKNRYITRKLFNMNK